MIQFLNISISQNVRDIRAYYMIFAHFSKLNKVTSEIETNYTKTASNTTNDFNTIDETYRGFYE